jgi:hypothetical protein
MSEFPPFECTYLCCSNYLSCLRWAYLNSSYILLIHFLAKHFFLKHFRRDPIDQCFFVGREKCTRKIGEHFDALPVVIAHNQWGLPNGPSISKYNHFHFHCQFCSKNSDFQCAAIWTESLYKFGAFLMHNLLNFCRKKSNTKKCW